MGRRPSNTTKTGRFMNPADQERKYMRLKELKRNRKQRTMTYTDIMNLYKQEKRDDIVKDLEKKLAKYEEQRNRKIQQYNAQRFSLETDPVEIPLPDGTSVPNAAMTPVAPAIPAHFLIPRISVGILKNAQADQGDFQRAEPPGPPCGLPPFLGSESDSEILPKRRVRFKGVPDSTAKDAAEPAASVLAPAENDLGPIESRRIHLFSVTSQAVIFVAVPTEIMQQKGNPVMGPMIPQNLLLRAPPTPPKILLPLPRLPLHAPPPPPNFPAPGLPQSFMRQPSSSSAITAKPVVRQIEESEQSKDNSEATISAGPELRDLAREVTKFVPTVLLVNRNKKKPKKAACK
ncbi:unnamed protein product [Gongylonema pulchrum]|uniref:WW domain-binding protein 11 n=1 Tax=Gongylonema pulchrum TaxID=637853 RepID=A0A183CVZ3_9BILA|nr:unnamed protein product [Gongylonema pulchrum]